MTVLILNFVTFSVFGAKPAGIPVLKVNRVGLGLVEVTGETAVALHIAQLGSVVFVSTVEPPCNKQSNILILIL